MSNLDKKYSLRLDLRINFINSTMKFDEFDINTSDFFIKVTRNKELIDISEAIVTLVAIKPDGTVESQFVTITENNVYCDLKNSMKDIPGRYEAIASITINGETINTDPTNPIVYEVTENKFLRKLDAAVVSEERFSILTDMINRLSTIENDESSRQEAELSREEAEKLRQEAMEKIKSDITKLIKDTNSKVDTNLKENSNKVDKLISDTETKIDNYKLEKDAAIQQDLKQYKTDTTQDIDNYKNLKGIEIDKDLEDYKTTTAKNISDYKDLKNAEIDNYKSEKDSQIDNYVTNKDKELDSYKLSKDKEINDFKDTKDVEINNKLKQVEVNETNRVQAETLRQQQHQSREEFLNGFSTRLEQAETKNTAQDTKLSQIENKNIEQDNTLQQVKSDVETLKNKPSVPVEIVQQVNKNTEDNKRQDIMLSGLFNENADGRLSTEENGNDIKLIGSKQGLVEVDKIVGNTLVNRISEPMRELTLNGDIDAEGSFVTTTEGADNGLIDVVCEGNTLVNILKKEASKQTTSERFLIGKPTTVTVIRNETVKTLLLAIYNKANDVWTTNISIPSNSLFTYTCSPDKYIGSVGAIINSNGNNTCFYSYDDYSNYPLTVLEGDYANKPIPTEYFEGMKSVGECADGNHKIEILSQNKNLLNIPSNLSTSSANSYKIYDDIDIFKIGETYVSSITTNNGDLTGFTHSSSYNIRVYFEDGSYIGLAPNQPRTNPSGKGKISYVYHNFSHTQFSANNGTATSYNIQIEKGTQATSYIPHASNKKEISLKEPLRGLPNGVKDRFVKIDGKWFVERNWSTVTLNGTQKIIEGSFDVPIFSYYIPNTKGEPNNREIALICDRIKPQTYNLNDNKHWALYTGKDSIESERYIRIQVPNSIVAKNDLDGFKNWLSSNPITIIYQLNTPIYEPLEIAPELTCYDEVTHISNNSIVPCNMKVKNTGFSCKALASNGTYTTVHDGGEGVTSNVDTTDNMVILSGKGKKVSDVMVLDGEVSKTYGSFEGMKSTFEDKLVTQEMVDAGLEKAENLGKYKVNVTVRSKNLKNLNTVNEDWANGKFNTTISQNNQNYHSCETFDVSDLRGQIVYRGIFRNGKFFNINSYFFVCIFDKDKKQIGQRFNMNRTTGYKIPPNAHYMRFMSYIGGNNSLESVKTDKYAIATEPFVEEETYEPFKEYKTSVYLNSPLLKGDEIVWKDGQLGIIHNSKLDKVSNNVAHCHDSYYKNDSTCVLVSLYKKRKYKEIICCDNLPTYIQSSNIWSRDYLCGISTVNDFYDLAIRLPHNVTGVNSITDDIKNKFKTYLSNNDIYFIGSLMEPYYEKISDNKFITEIPNNATLNIDSTIPCQNIKASYTGNLPSVYSLEETGITNTNDIAATQTAVDFLLMSSMGEVMMMSFNENTRGGNNMGAYFASRIMKKALKYEDVIRKYQEFKEDIDFILRSEGYGDLIVEVQ